MVDSNINCCWSFLKNVIFANLQNKREFQVIFERLSQTKEKYLDTIKNFSIRNFLKLNNVRTATKILEEG